MDMVMDMVMVTVMDMDMAIVTLKTLHHHPK